MLVCKYFRTMQLYNDGDSESDDKTDNNTSENSSNVVSSYEMAIEVDDLPTFQTAAKPLRIISKKRKHFTKNLSNDSDSIYSKSVMNTSASEFTPDAHFVTSSQTSRDFLVKRLTNGKFDKDNVKHQ